MNARNEAYVVLTCDGRVEMVQCRGCNDYFVRSWCNRHGGNYSDMFNAWELGKWSFPYVDSVVGKFVQVEFPKTSVLGREDLMWDWALAQSWFYGKTACPLFNKVVWRMAGELCLGDVVGGPMEISKARQVLAAINEELARSPDLPIPREVIMERFIKTDDPEFFDRCNRRGLLAPFDVVLQLVRPDYLWFAENCPYVLYCCEDDEDGDYLDEWEKIDETPGNVFVRLNTYRCYDLRKPLNDGPFQSLCGHTVDEWIRSGRAKLFVALRFDDAKKFELFESEEGASRGQNWEVVFERSAVKDEKLSIGCDDAVLVATSLPIPWVDKTPWRLGSVCGVGGGAK